MSDGQESSGEQGWIAPVIPLGARRTPASGGHPRADNDERDRAVEASPGRESREARAPATSVVSGLNSAVAFLPGVREADERRAENVSLHALTRRGMSRAEVLDLLKRREIDPIVAEGEIARLEGSGLIDDEALARTLVERLTERKKLGPSAIRAELQRRRLSSATIEVALAEREVEDEGALLDGLVDERLRRMGSLDRETAERRLLAFLARKGHGGLEARTSIRRALDDAGLPPAPRSGLGQRGLGQRGQGQSGLGGGFGRRSASRAASPRGDGAADGPRAVEFE